MIVSRTLIMAGFLVTVAGGAIWADPRGSRSEPRRSDHDEARRAVQRGEIRTLGEILVGLRSRFPGHVIEVELKRDKGAYVYELKLLEPDGRVREVVLDAKTGKLIASEHD